MFRSKNPLTKRNCSYYSIYSWGGALSIENNTLYMFRTLGCIGMHRCLHQNQPSNSFCPHCSPQRMASPQILKRLPLGTRCKDGCRGRCVPGGPGVPLCHHITGISKAFFKRKDDWNSVSSVEGVGWYWCIRQIRLNPEMVEQRWDAVACGGAG